jgi:hypothetical protein
MKKILTTFISLAVSIFLFAQDSVATHADKQPTGLRAEGKVYVVLAVALTILIALFIYLIRLDRKISKLEKETR